MPEMVRWVELTCPCGSTRFCQTFTLRWHPGGGSSTGAPRYICAECHAVADVALMRRQVERERLKRQMAELEEQFEAEDAPRDAPESASPVPGHHDGEGQKDSAGL